MPVYSFYIYISFKYPPHRDQLAIRANYPFIPSSPEIHEMTSFESPKLPTISFDFLKNLNDQHLREASEIRGNKTFYYYEPSADKRFFLKPCELPQAEYELMIQAGPKCVIQPVALVFSPPKSHYPWGIMMPLAEPINNWTVGMMEAAIAAMELLHKRRILHCDIHPAQFILWNSKVVLCDLGSAQYLKKGSDSEAERYPVDSSWNYFSPKRLRDIYNEKFTPATVHDDKYAMGLTIWAIETKKRPYGVDNDDVAYAVVERGVTVNFGEVEDQQARLLIEKSCPEGLR